MRGSPSLTLPEGFKPRGWTANRPRIEPCMIGKRGEKSMKPFIMILCYTHGSLPSSIFNRKASPRSWCKQVDTQPNIVQGKPMEEGEEGLWKPEGQGQDWKLHRINLSGFMGAHGNWTTNQRTCIWLTWALCTCAAFVCLGLLVGPLAEVAEAVWFCCLILGPFPPAGLTPPALIGE